MYLATVNFGVLTTAVFLRKKKSLHTKLMTAGISGDLALVLILEFQRGAIDTALEMSMSFWQQAHIFSSTIATFLYFPVLILGFLRFKNLLSGHQSRHWHMRLGITAYTFRTLGFVLMFSMIT